MAMVERDGNISVWWFPRAFSQSRYGEFSRSGRNSCTLISLILANKIAWEAEFCQAAGELPRKALLHFGDAINEGNELYNRIGAKARPSKNFNIPDAIAALRLPRRQPGAPDSPPFRLRELYYTHLRADPAAARYPQMVGARLTDLLKIGLEMQLQQSEPGSAESTESHSSPTASPVRHLFAVIIADSRTVTFVFEILNRVVAFYDSHQHGRNAGAVIAQSSFESLNELIHWFVGMLEDIYSSQPDLYEISFLSTETRPLTSPFAHAPKKSQ